MKRIPKEIKTTVTQAKTLARDVASRLQGGEVLALIGNLGAGKTTFTQALAQALGIAHSVSSPTFVLQQTYPIPNTQIHLDHFDLYRLETEDEIQKSGLVEHWGNPHIISVIEWADKAENLLPSHTIYIYFS
ncbi:MAG: tRNA (adenosine(37)-N6)-threonylcarbamoyltransferase complex ATPase subunit type 1 TsaE [Candidatus Doudnabacteria bacterium]|nr:tRNA (adenosine(37)-N6)-threonylcarbamoyltransferase complex ATPase subunit type 1 TsaE [Candidatus Doudnabacteria bacterium]